ncbi:type II restriction endonuclease [Pseudomonas moraviensis]
MYKDKTSDYFEGVAAKYLRAVDANPNKSNQHEIGGLPSAGFMRFLGTPKEHEKIRFRAKQVYITDESLAPEVSEGRVTWYDVRSYDTKRDPEYRLYYYPNSVTELISEGDFLLIAKMRDGSLLMVFTPPGGTIENQLRLLFGLDHVGGRVKAGSLDNVALLLPLRLMLEGLGLDLGHKDAEDDEWLSRLIKDFGGDKFPTTSVFSEYARKSLTDIIDPVSSPDNAIVGWMEHEEKLFRIYERYLVQQRLRKGFGYEGEDVEAFISFSLSVQNRRKSRVGHAFEGHLSCIFKLHGLNFQKGGGKGFTTENNSKPDFVFPGFMQYRDPEFPLEKLVMLGAKTTCKDRWRQVLSEAYRVKSKHLVTLEAAISERQTSEMKSHGLNLVVPLPIQKTYSEEQQGWLLGLSDFIEFVRNSQALV